MATLVKSCTPSPVCYLMLLLFSWPTLAVATTAAEQIASELASRAATDCEKYFCTGDVYPRSNDPTRGVVKLGGKYVFVPRRYFAGTSAHASFFLTPEGKPGSITNATDHELAAYKADRLATIDVFIELDKPEFQSVTSAIFTQAKQKGIVESTRTENGLRYTEFKPGTIVDGVDRSQYTFIELGKRPLSVDETPIATCINNRTFQSRRYDGGTNFRWRTVFRVSVAFPKSLCKQWAAIFVATESILNDINDVK